MFSSLSNREVKAFNTVRGRQIILWSLVLLFFFIYTLQVVLNHFFLRTYALDYGFYNQAFWDFAHLRTNSNTVFEPPLETYFQIHPGFTLLLISPLYWIFTPIFGTYSLLIIQNIFIVSGGYCVYLLIKEKTCNFWLAILAFLHFNVIWGHYSALSSDFIETTIAASMVPAFLLYFNRRKFFLSCIVFLFIITCKENMPLWFIFISVTLILSYKEKDAKMFSLGLAIFSLLYFLFLFAFLIPHFERPGLPYGGFAYTALGKTPGEALQFIFTHPFQTFRLLFINHLGDPSYNFIKAEFYKVFLVSGGILLLIRPVYIIPFIPIIAQKMLNDSIGRWGILGFYSIEAVSILSVFVFFAVDRISNTSYKVILCSILCISTFSVTLNKLDQRTSLWYDISKENMLKSSFYKSDMDVRKIRRQIASFVPADSSFAASQSIVPHFSQRKKSYIFPFVHDARYIVILKDNRPYPLTPEQFESQMSKYRASPDWECVLDDHPLLILRRVTNGNNR
ncbi:MAG TPA: DUF2079 domain-containing protein [Bacteroidales bacterium]|nr:DUF2079 domain-containing protein [Bacteroidales bacterium]